MPEDALKSYKLTVRLNTVNNILELLVFSNRKMLWRKVTMVYSAIYSSCECLLSKAIGNSNCQY